MKNNYASRKTLPASLKE